MKHVLVICPSYTSVWQTFGKVSTGETPVAHLEAGDVCLILQISLFNYDKNGEIIKEDDTLVLTPEGAIGWIGPISSEMTTEA